MLTASCCTASDAVSDQMDETQSMLPDVPETLNVPWLTYCSIYVPCPENKRTITTVTASTTIVITIRKC